MRPSTLADLAAKYDRPVPEIRGYGSFTVFSAMYEAATDVLRERADWGARRIQHGVRSFEVPALVERLAAEQICLDVCPTSNLMLAVLPSLAEHPLPALLDAGVRCSVNADDPLLFGPSLLDEYELCRREFGFADDRLADIVRTSIECGNAPDEVRTAALDGIDRWLVGASG